MFLRNYWYCAMWAKDLGPGPVAKTLLDEPVVFWRMPDGAPVALEDRCCHRSLPLSLGKVVGDRVQCGYHGLEFDRTGACVRVPGQSAVPPGAWVTRYPTVQRHNVIWIWMGEAGAADPALIPDLPWLDDPAWVCARGCIHMNANFQLLVDNLLDLTHVSYLHTRTISGDASIESQVIGETRRGDDEVRFDRWMLDIPPPPMFKTAGNFQGNVDRWQLVRWTPPSTVVLDIGCADAGTGAPQGDRRCGISMWSNHLITPETARSTHYHWCYARNYRLDEPEVTELLQKGGDLTFNEDVAAIEIQQRRLDETADRPLVDINIDNAPLQTRRIYARLLEAEQAARRPPAAAE
jgi:phenylpropionate dioxygenase-like ring-hydroxylating dioxygenase large terminal subunit